MEVRQFYRAFMSSFVCRLLVLVAVLLMPFGMSAAPAATAHNEHMSAMPMQHCPDQNSTPHSNGMLADCTMACSAALPATSLDAVETHCLVRPPLGPTAVARLSGIELEIATPPPRLS